MNKRPSKLQRHKRRVKSRKTKLVERADALMRQICLQQHPNCEACGKGEHQSVLHAHHWVKRSRSNALRHDPKNLVTMCAGCHRQLHWGEPEIMVAVKESREDGWHEDLMARRRDTIKTTISHYLEVIEMLEARLETKEVV